MATIKTLLKENNNDVLTYSVLNGIDTTNVLSGSVVAPYTAQEDCFVFVDMSANTPAKIDGVETLNIVSSSSTQMLFLKKGQTITNVVDIHVVYGIKR